MGVNLIEHKGNQILYADNKGLIGEDLVNNMMSVNKKAKEMGHNILLLADFRDASLSKEATEYLKGDEAKEAATRYKKQALVGIKGIKKMFANLYGSITNSNIRIFNTIEEAKEYLISS